MTVLLLLAVVLMVVGYRAAEWVPVYTPLPGMGHLNNTLMLVSLFLFGVGGTKGTLYPQDAASDAVGRGGLGGGAFAGEWRSGVTGAVWRHRALGAGRDGADQPGRGLGAADATGAASRAMR